jgi:hypothetical protein
MPQEDTWLFSYPWRERVQDYTHPCSYQYFHTRQQRVFGWHLLANRRGFHTHLGFMVAAITLS